MANRIKVTSKRLPKVTSISPKLARIEPILVAQALDAETEPLRQQETASPIEEIDVAEPFVSANYSS